MNREHIDKCCDSRGVNAAHLALQREARRAIDEAHPVDLRDGLGRELDRFAMYRAADLVAHAFAERWHDDQALPS